VEFVDAKTAAELLGVERWRLAAMRRSGRIPGEDIEAANRRVIKYRLNSIRALAWERIEREEKEICERKDRLRAFRSRELVEK
jgi:hypothetical protein